MTPHRSKTRTLLQALMTALVLCGISGPLRAADEEARVLMLYGADP
jgi:hypothetical protein